MKMQAMVPIKDFPYGGKMRRKGRSFDAAAKDVRILVALGRAQIDPAAEPAAPAPAEPRKPEEVRAVVEEAIGVTTAPPAKRAYRRRNTFLSSENDAE